MENINSYNDFISKTTGLPKHYLLLYRKGSEQSVCAMGQIGLAEGATKGVSVFSADVTDVRDIHTVYGVDSVPSLLVFENGRLAGIIKGCHESSYYSALMENKFYVASGPEEGSPAKRVTVYSTPTCSWCNTLKSWLKKNNINFSDIDISRDEKAAEALVRRSGQQGVPQTDVNGEIVVGFNQARLKELLNL
ncbi:MAG: hypothetical protein JXR66_03015 [Bacteroidales bacterium]|nr:hypothetical protein [Bacteroidales bacterium]MBN2632500.1 hypothetical protein [Bacteroidales bacterium]